MSDVTNVVSPEEWSIRQDLAAAYRLVAPLRLGRLDLHSSHRTRSRTRPHFLIETLSTGKFDANMQRFAPNAPIA